MRLCNLNVPAMDVMRVVAILSGQSQATIENAQLLQRLFSLNVSPDDMSIIVDAMQKCAQPGGVADNGAALIMRLCNINVPPTDVTCVVAILSGNSKSTIEDAQLLQRLFNLNVSPDDMNIIVDATQKSAQVGGVAYRDPYVDPAAPPQYYVKGKSG